MQVVPETVSCSEMEKVKNDKIYMWVLYIVVDKLKE